MDTKVTIRDRSKALNDILRALNAQGVMVGIPAETAGRDDGPINNAAIGYILETGAPERNLPARPFLRPGVASAAGDVAKVARTTLGRALAFGRTRGNVSVPESNRKAETLGWSGLQGISRAPVSAGIRCKKGNSALRQTIVMRESCYPNADGE